MSNEPIAELPIPEDIQKRLDDWYRLYWIFTAIHYVFGVGGVLASTLAAGLTTPCCKTAWSIVAAVCIAVLVLSSLMPVIINM